MKRQWFVLSLLLTVLVTAIGIFSRHRTGSVRPERLRPAIEASAEDAAADAPQVEVRSKPARRMRQRIALREQPTPAEPGDPRVSLDPDENRDWARKHPEAAFTWMVNAPEGPQRDAIAEVVCAQFAESNPAQAMATAERYCPTCTNLLEGLAQQWAEQDQRAAYSWAVSHPAGEARDNLLSRIAFIESKSAPEQAATLVAEQISPGKIQDEAAISVLYQWALRDTKSAMAWAQSFPPGNLRERAIFEVEKVAAGVAQDRNAM